jgi:hypothetical protein
MKLHVQHPGWQGYIVSALMGSIILGGYWWMAGKMLYSSGKPDLALARPHLQTRFVIDSVDKDDMAFHIQIENMPGSPAVDRLACNYRSLTMKTRDSIDTTLPSGGHLSVPGVPVNG